MFSAKDVTKDYCADKFVGHELSFDENYSIIDHQNEIVGAKWLLNTFGGKLHLLKEINKFEIKTPDFLWNDIPFEYKKILTSKKNTLDSRIREAYKQIGNNEGGILLEATESPLSLQEISEMAVEIAKRRSKYNSILIIKNTEEYKVFAIKKE